MSGSEETIVGRKFLVVRYYVVTVSEHGNVIANYVKNRGNEYKKLFRNKRMGGQTSMFDYM